MLALCIFLVFYVYQFHVWESQWVWKCVCEYIILYMCEWLCACIVVCVLYNYCRCFGSVLRLLCGFSRWSSLFFHCHTWTTSHQIWNKLYAFHVLVQTNFVRYYFYFLPDQAQILLNHFNVLDELWREISTWFDNRWRNSHRPPL